MPIRSDHLLGGIQVDAGTLHRFSRNIEIHSSHNPLSLCGSPFWIWFGVKVASLLDYFSPTPKCVNTGSIGAEQLTSEPFFPSSPGFASRKREGQRPHPHYSEESSRSRHPQTIRS
jgi:hypothetical protein